MRLLILSCSTGDGHNSAARALLEAAGRQGADAEMRDPVSFGGETARRAVAGAYNGMIRRVPALFGAVYRIGDLYDRSRLPSPIYAANALYAEALGRFVTEGRFDAVISTHLYGMEGMCAARRKGFASAPSYGVLTDYTFIPFFEEPDIDAVFLPHPDLTEEGVKKGIDRARLIPTGIPVSARFGEEMTREAAREKLGIRDAEKIYLVMSGGVGCSNMAKLTSALAWRVGNRDRIVVLCGRNEKLRRDLETRWADFPGVLPVGFTRDVPLWMKAADVTVSKAGGLSSTEAAAAGTPLVHMMTIPGCETKNAAFFAARSMSVCEKSIDKAAAAAVRLAENEEEREGMRRAQRENIRRDAADSVIGYVRTQLR